MCHWRGLTVWAWGILGTIKDSLAMDTTRGTSTLFKFLCPTIAPQNSGFFHLSEEKNGVWLWNINSTHLFDFHTWKRHFVCPVTVLALWSPQRLIKCSRRCFVLYILRWDGDPMAGVSPQILGRITLTQFHPLYKAPRGFIFSYFTNLRTLKTSQTLKLSSLPKSSDLREAFEVTLVFIFVSFHVPRLFYSWPISLAFHSLLLFQKHFLRFSLVCLDG